MHNPSELDFYEFSEIFDGIVELSIRREFLCKNSPLCNRCSTNQVQLINYIDTPAKWKCRKCGSKFSFEPEVN